MSNHELTHSELAVLTAIVCHIEAHGYAPSTRELCEMTGIKSTSTLHSAKMALKEKGIIECASGKNRAIKVKDGPKIVLCKNCKHRHKTNTGLAIWDICHRLNRRTEDDFYCAYGREKDE